MSDSPKMITAWSASRYKDYSTCPRKAKYKHIDKLREPGSPAMDRGLAVHKSAELYVQGQLPSNPFTTFAGEWSALLDVLKRQKTVVAEEKWCFDVNWADTPYFGPNAWLRMGIDAYYFTKGKKVMTIVDYKTGKVYEGNEQQLDLYALGAFTRTDAKEVRAQFWYLDANELVEIVYDRSDQDALREEWMAKIRSMMHDTMFPARPGQHCKWCFFSKAKNGPCEF